ncbi:MAG: chromosome segregation protein ScpA [Planctomycetota bacterium]|nr:MAG: chromosome segregation protein ScpA [Planctomycetota bacterium]REJ94267.1 MAG: chromosome segregation protein ScpA [Planctomycetota bacterium]REK20240.1 MAG: chromosome segregation protein ScpA [Planctomycetota bacterium]REK35427.1 MAG: chromosome segregation protein ScpA [Planctomycetota bacterium]
MSTPSYRVQLELFEGPLDLLLYLVRRNEVDVVELPIARITAQFQEFLEILQMIDLDIAGDFVVMASTLAEVKSRLVLPQPEEEAAEEEIEPLLEGDDARSELIQRLLDYKKYKDAATDLEDRAAEWQERYPRLSDERPKVAKDHAADRIKEVELWDLISALGRVLRRSDVQEEQRIRYDDTPIHVYVDQIGTRVRAEGPVRFSTLFDSETIRSKIVGMFLAILELLRHHGFRATQESVFGDITVFPPAGGTDQPD